MPYNIKFIATLSLLMLLAACTPSTDKTSFDEISFFFQDPTKDRLNAILYNCVEDARSEVEENCNNYFALAFYYHSRLHHALGKSLPHHIKKRILDDDGQLVMSIIEKIDQMRLIVKGNDNDFHSENYERAELLEMAFDVSGEKKYVVTLLKYFSSHPPELIALIHDQMNRDGISPIVSPEGQTKSSHIEFSKNFKALEKNNLGTKWERRSYESVMYIFNPLMEQSAYFRALVKEIISDSPELNIWKKASIWDQ